MFTTPIFGKLRGTFFTLFLVVMGPFVPAPSIAHPLDPLTREEHWAVLKVLRDAGKVTDQTRFTRLALKTPDKASVWAWKPGADIERSAEVIIKEGKTTYEAIVDLRAHRLVSWLERSGVQPPWLNEEFSGETVERLQNSQAFQQAVRKHGVEHPERLACSLNPKGNLGEEKFAGHRIGIVTCQQPAERGNPAPHEIKGFNAIADVNTGEVLEFYDDEVTPDPEKAAVYDPKSQGKPRQFPTPIEIEQPQGPSFKVEGNVVQWDRWRFHIRSDQRVGLIISTVTWNDGTEQRPILYEGHLSEIFVPYMAPYKIWAARTHLDAGENSAGGLSGTLEPGVHCPRNAVYFDAIVVEDNGRPKDKPRVVCLFERLAGEVSWVHGGEGRQKRVLVARMDALAGNYDYLIDWVFKPDGEIRVDVGATGIIGVRASAQKNAASATPENAGKDAELYGRFVDDHLIGINHSHYFNFRFDLDVDGMENRFAMDGMRQVLLPKDNPRRSLWVSETHVIERERDVLDTQSHDEHPLWRVMSTSRRNRQGYPTSYQILPGNSGHVSFLSEDDMPRRRAGFIDHELWVTPYDADELYAAGKYPTQSGPGEGLPAWTKQNRSIKDRDIVVWYTIAMHHVVRSEDWPVMPTVTHSISLRPFDFFDRNPAIDTDAEP